MPVKRSRLTILVDVMKALQGEGRPASRICEYANLPYDRLVPILEKLEKEGFVVYEKKGKARIYKLTDILKLLISKNSKYFALNLLIMRNARS